MARSTAFDIHFTLRRAKSSCLRNLTNDREICRYSAICSSFNPYADNAISSQIMLQTLKVQLRWAAQLLFLSRRMPCALNYFSL